MMTIYESNSGAYEEELRSVSDNNNLNLIHILNVATHYSYIATVTSLSLTQ